MRSLLVRVIPVLAVVVGGLSLGVWLLATPAAVEPRLEQASTDEIPSSDVEFVGENFLSLIKTKPPSLPGSWPGFRGLDHNGVSPDETPLLRQWPEAGPATLWTVAVGQGYGGPAIRAGRVYLLDYKEEKDETQNADVLRCFSLDDGSELWRRWYNLPIPDDHGITRTVPVVNDTYCVTIGPKCHVLCVNAVTGELKWGLDMVKRYNTQWPKWYTGQCPLLDMDNVVLAPAGEKVLMTSLECKTGKTRWETPNVHGWKMTHSSIVPMTFKDFRMFVYVASGGVVGVCADDGGDFKAGDVLWEFPDWQVPFANVPSPVLIGDGRILLSGGYGGGSAMIQIKGEAGHFTAEQVWRKKKSEEFSAEMHTPILYNGLLYGALPEEAGTLRNQLVCVDLAAQHVWESGPNWQFGRGPMIIADGLLLAMNEKGRLTMAEATSAGFKPLGSATVIPEARESWAPMAIAGGRLLVRDMRRLICLDLRKE
jgi:outer membrane protein assembly factor BamB